MAVVDHLLNCLLRRFSVPAPAGVTCFADDMRSFAVQTKWKLVLDVLLLGLNLFGWYRGSSASAFAAGSMVTLTIWHSVDLVRERTP